MNIKERNELLIRLDERTERLVKDFENHLQHHFRYSVLAWTITVGALITAIFALI